MSILAVVKRRFKHRRSLPAVDLLVIVGERSLFSRVIFVLAQNGFVAVGQEPLFRDG